jgi:peroxiredoxin
LNKLVKEYSNRSDVEFISLALDSSNEIKSFLKKNNLNYSVIPNMENFILSKLGIEIFPTHIVIDQQGRIMKVFNDAKKLQPILNKLFRMTNSYKSL